MVMDMLFGVRHPHRRSERGSFCQVASRDSVAQEVLRSMKGSLLNFEAAPLLDWLPGETLFSIVSRHHCFWGHTLSSRTSLLVFRSDRTGRQHDFYGWLGNPHPELKVDWEPRRKSHGRGRSKADIRLSWYPGRATRSWP